MPTIIIPKGIDKNEKLIAVPETQFGEFLEWQKKIKFAKTFKPTKAEKKALARARRNLARGDYLTLDELRAKLGLAR